MFRLKLLHSSLLDSFLGQILATRTSELRWRGSHEWLAATGALGIAGTLFMWPRGNGHLRTSDGFIIGVMWKLLSKLTGGIIREKPLSPEELQAMKLRLRERKAEVDRKKTTRLS